MKRSVADSFTLIVLSCFLAGCDASTPATTQAVAEAPTIDVVLAGRQFKLEVAATNAEREKGLMFRKSMPIDHGMLFVFPDVAPRQFWMKNTLLPLDIAYLDEGGLVLNIAQMYPNDLTPVPSDGPAKYAIELNQGLSQRIGLKAGDHVTLPVTKAE